MVSISARSIISLKHVWIVRGGFADVSLLSSCVYRRRMGCVTGCRRRSRRSGHGRSDAVAGGSERRCVRVRVWVDVDVNVGVGC